MFYSNKDLALAQQVQTSLDEQKQVNLMLKEPIDLRLDMDELRATFMSTAQGRVTSWRGNPGTTRMHDESDLNTSSSPGASRRASNGRTAFQAVHELDKLRTSQTLLQLHRELQSKGRKRKQGSLTTTNAVARAGSGDDD